jgi:hypothetical protein
MHIQRKQEFLNKKISSLAMPTLIACLSTGKGTWTEVNKLMQAHPWSKIFLITNQFGVDNFTSKSENTELLVINSFPDTPITVMIESIKKQLEGKINDFEVALNFCSGTGKEHLALVEAVLELGLNFRLVTINNANQLEVLGLKR